MDQITRNIVPAISLVKIFHRYIHFFKRNTGLFSKPYLLESARTIAAVQVNSIVVCTNFLIGKYIVEHESRGNTRADYAEKMICILSARLTKEFGPGYSERNLWLFKKFYQMYTGTIKVQTASALLLDTDKNRNDRQILQTVSAVFHFPDKKSKNPSYSTSYERKNPSYQEMISASP